MNHLSEPDFNGSASSLTQDYREWARDSSAVIEVEGVYVYETIHTVEARGDWSRGSVSVPVEMWGEWPPNRAPRVIAPEDRSGPPPDSCGWGPEGQAVGTRTYLVVASVPHVYLLTEGLDPDSVLTTAFGAPTVAERDTAGEADLIAQIDATRKRSTRIYFAAGLGALALAAAGLSLSRRSSRRRRTLLND